ncbi:peptidoglycan DD-metalloendopeptidase family protein [Sulfuritalea hydrogenivorans]|uniref:Metalloendopeptidase-like membrane protein n=1 Tax=Sulfuritalea hydrogenivorans sk43H TaxID=1223802 RepID=W0SGX2_9PROT|nr:peptidoglycan DD-metalloendopeptidase family protein [Sulfuritalea hydrogenivorans]BAO30212.1 metalloendopeptidase-like membrane protein [Sulfuritalea hydrogenivorans sk43H]
MNAARLMLVMLLPIIAGCASHAPAPVEERGGAPAATKPAAPVQAAATTDSRIGYHSVKKGDTLYSIALDNGQDYKDVAAWNNLENPNRIMIGQQLRVTPPDNGAPVAVAKPVSSGGPIEVKQSATPASSNTDTLKREPRGGKLAYSEEALARARQGEAAARPVDTRPEPKPVEAQPVDKPVVAGDEVEWMWPASGKLITPFAEGSSKGIDIAGKGGDPVLAAAGGVVSYAGAGLRGYGNLVVLRHNGTYLSVYAHNSKILVKEKQTVTKGQKIAEIGSTDSDSPRLHFEIRRQGKPADPQKFLPAR